MKTRLLSILCYCIFGQVLLFAQDTEQGKNVNTQPDIPIETPVVDEWQSLWRDSRMTQIEEIAMKLERLMTQNVTIKSAAVYEVSFLGNIGQDFRQTALSKIYQVFSRVPNFYAARCDECFQIRTQISGNTLRVSRGIADPVYRRKIALRMNAEGFMKVVIAENEEQLSVAIEIYDAKNGQLVFSEMVSATPVIPEPSAFDLNVGQMQFSAKFKSESANISKMQTYQIPTISFGKSYRILENWYFSGDITIIADIAEKDQNAPAISGGLNSLAFYGKSIYNFVSIGQDRNITFGFIAGLGQWLSPQLKFPILISTGFRMMMGKMFLFNFEYVVTDIKDVKSVYNDDGTNIDDMKASINSATNISLGIRF